MKAIIRLLAIVSLFALRTSARAQSATDDELARNYFNLGTAQLDRGDYEEAVASFERAYAYSHRAALLFNLYIAEERLGNLEAAIDYLSRYLASDEPIENRGALEMRLDNLRRRLAARRAGTPEEPPEPAPVETPITQTPSGPSATGTAPSEEPVDAVQPSRVATTAAASDEASDRPLRLAPMLLWSSAGAASVSFTVAALLARAEDHALQRHCISDLIGPACPASRVETLRRRDIVADTSLGLTVALAATALVVQLVGRDETPRVAVAPFVGRDSAGLSTGGRF